jgi:hypothetical protein
MIVVPGVSRSGKSSVLRAFIRIAKHPHRSYSFDGFLPSLTPGVFEARAGDGEGWNAICADFRRYLANARTSAGRSIVKVALAWPEARENLFGQIGRGEIPTCSKPLSAVNTSKRTAVVTPLPEQPRRPATCVAA